MRFLLTLKEKISGKGYFIDDLSESKVTNIYVPSGICSEKTIFEKRRILIFFTRKSWLGMNLSGIEC